MRRRVITIQLAPANDDGSRRHPRLQDDFHDAAASRSPQDAPRGGQAPRLHRRSHCRGRDPAHDHTDTAARAGHDRGGASTRDHAREPSTRDHALVASADDHQLVASADDHQLVASAHDDDIGQRLHPPGGERRRRRLRQPGRPERRRRLPVGGGATIGSRRKCEKTRPWTTVGEVGTRLYRYSTEMRP
jgi:hypothetical protein